MKQLLTLLTLLFLTSTSQTFACDCENQGHFLTVAPKSKLVALVKVRAYSTFENINETSTPTSMKVEIVEIFYGEETRKTITVWGDNGHLCRPYLNIFNTDNYYVIAFEQDSKENPGDYAISNCGDYWLSFDYEKKVATGQVSENQDQMTLGNLFEYFRGEKTADLTPTDFKEIFQLALDLPKLQQYFHADTDKTREQLIIQYIGEVNHNNLTGVEKFGKQLQMMSEEDIMKQHIRFYIVLGDWVCGLNSVRMQLSFVGEGLTASYMIKKVEGKWTILNYEIWED